MVQFIINEQSGGSSPKKNKNAKVRSSPLVSSVDFTSSPLVSSVLFSPKGLTPAELKRLLDSKDDEGITALMKSAEEGEIDVCQLLVSQGASASAKDDEGTLFVDLDLFHSFRV